ncbi:response regulator transcription factor [Paenibacillus radicis (ex Gao et al. 2016)]|uniref:Two-component sensor response regulator n=1 Tax=Paenibacillus radicis (ex Gao et al. 2016) TaxID=1737354 RepID=A0A917LUM6_9BACL|nr:response regulator [Paenibacillus radicis (ex Gao et al. 2016)]GGG58981.1 putative two-component sensor response regulator [Paenibacillus radicis (ex Gao et al. 2016)]
MYKVLIVDDESWVVESLKDLVNWEQYGFEVAGQAANGGEALTAIEAMNPDVVFTDIRMPEMNGLELIRRGKTMGKTIRFVVVSGYAEFAYAQKALSYGAAAYCLKPFDEIEIGGVLAKLKESLDNARPVREDMMQLLLDESGGRNEEKLLGMLGEQGILQWIEQGIVPVVAIGRSELPLPPGRVIKLITGTAKTAYLMSEEQSKAMLGKGKELWPEDIMGIGLGNRLTDWKEIKGAIEEADIAAYQCFIAGKPGVYSLPHTKDTELKSWMAEIHAAIGNKDSEIVQYNLDRIEALFEEGALTIRHAFQVYNLTISFLFDLGRKETILYSYEQLVRLFKNVSEMMTELKSLADQYVQQKSAHAPESKNQTFNPILQFVTENYRRDLSLQDLANQFFMNPSYISQLFKKEVGETFTAYVAKLRVAQACELLERGDSSIQDIAEKIGYRDYFYFTRIFKKLTGQTPTQYRETHPRN